MPECALGVLPEIIYFSTTRRLPADGQLWVTSAEQLCRLSPEKLVFLFASAVGAAQAAEEQQPNACRNQYGKYGSRGKQRM